MILENQDI